MKSYGFIVLMLIISMSGTIAPVSANTFDWLNNIFDVPAQNQPSEEIIQGILVYNTNQNINLISDYMNDYNVNTIQVHIIELNKDFFVIKNVGVSLQPQSKPDKIISLTISQIEHIEGYISDGELSQWERFQLWLIYKQGG